DQTLLARPVAPGAPHALAAGPACTGTRQGGRVDGRDRPLSHGGGAGGGAGARPGARGGGHSIGRDVQPMLVGRAPLLRRPRADDDAGAVARAGGSGAGARGDTCRLPAGPRPAGAPSAERHPVALLPESHAEAGCAPARRLADASLAPGAASAPPTGG